MKSISLFISILMSTSLIAQQKIDLLVYNALVYTVDKDFSTAEAIAVDKGKIIAVGKSNDLVGKYIAAQKIDAKGKFIYPGFIDAHCHFLAYGLGLQQIDLVGTKSWDEVLQKIKSFSETHKEGWLIGRGWDQNDWDVKEFPTNEKLNELFPDRAVVLKRVDGHAAIANAKALKTAGLKPLHKIHGGIVETKDGKLTGILIDNAIDLVTAKIPAPTMSEKYDALLAAEKKCFEVGLTTVDDCGLDYEDVVLIRGLQNAERMKMRMYVMLNDSKKNLDFIKSHGKISEERLTMRSYKVYADGALGSRGASLLQPYSDQTGWYGLLLSKPEHFDSVASFLFEHDFQMCAHAIGDSANRMILNIYAKHLKGKNDKRWRIEHAQVVNENDFQLFGKYNIIPSVQPTHATSDMYWAAERLGNKRIRTAYAYGYLQEQNGWIPLGTDFPVEDISPLKTFYAAIVRKDANGFPENGFQMENALLRKDALCGITIWAAKSNFEENQKGSIEVGKYADFVLLDKDLMMVDAKEILSAKVTMTFLNGELVYERK